MKDICRDKMGWHCIEGQLSGKSTPTNVGPFSPLSLSSAPPSGPLLVSFSPADISVMTFWAPQCLRPHCPWLRYRASLDSLRACLAWFTSSSVQEMSIMITRTHPYSESNNSYCLIQEYLIIPLPFQLSWTFLPSGRFIADNHRCCTWSFLDVDTVFLILGLVLYLNSLWMFIWWL